MYRYAFTLRNQFRDRKTVVFHNWYVKTRRGIPTRNLQHHVDIAHEVVFYLQKIIRITLRGWQCEKNY